MKVTVAGAASIGFICSYFMDLTIANAEQYLAVAAVLLLGGLIYTNWWVVVFVIVMLNVGVWTKLCPSKWIFEKLGLKKCQL